MKRDVGPSAGATTACSLAGDVVAGQCGHHARARQAQWDLVGANPVDRGKPGSKLHLVCDGNGLPLAVAVTAANTNDSEMFEGLLDDVPAVRTPCGQRRCRPGKVHADKRYDARQCRQYLRQRGIRPRIARRGIESSQRLGQHRWRVERAHSWLGCWRHRQVRWDRGSGRFYAFILLACALICFNRIKHEPERGEVKMYPRSPQYPRPREVAASMAAPPCPPGQPPLSAYASAESVLQGATISFFVPVTAAVQPPVTMQVRFMGRDPLLVEQAGIRPTPAPLPATPYASGCQITTPSATFQVPTGPTARSGWYEARFFDAAGNTTYVPFVARRNPPSPAQAIVILATATAQAYNYWGGANFYNGPPTLGGYIHGWDYLAEAHFSHQVSFDRPGWCWQEGGYPLDFRDVNGAVDFLEAELGPGNVDYATSTDLHFDASLLNSYNLMISIGHDEYWSREMRNNVERFITQFRGNVCFFGANTCWWQVRFENRGPGGELIAASDRRKLVCYKMEGSPVLYEDGVRVDEYDYSKDPMWLTDRSRITTHWHAPTVNRPENRLTGVSYRNGAYYEVAANEDVQYTAQYPQHWAFARPDPPPGSSEQPGMTFSRGTRFGGAIFKVSPEWDAALTRNETGGYPAATGEDGSPLNYLPLATCTTATGNPYDGSQPGRATMGLFRNHGVVFHAGILGWRYGMNKGWQSDRTSDVSLAQISHNVLQRLRQKGPWKYEAELHNAYFESWVTTPAAPTPLPEHWIVEGGGGLGLASVSKGDLCPLSGNHSLDVDARQGQVWITQDWFNLPSLACERYTRYRVGVFVKASAPGGASVYLQTSGGRQFALAQNAQANAWETIEGIAEMDAEGPMFDAHVVMVVNQGVVASFSDVSVFEWDTAARLAPRYTH